MRAILYDKVNFQNFSSLDYSKYIPVRTRMYRYVQVQTSTKPHKGTVLDQARKVLSLQHPPGPLVHGWASSAPSPQTC